MFAIYQPLLFDFISIKKKYYTGFAARHEHVAGIQSPVFEILYIVLLKDKRTK